MSNQNLLAAKFTMTQTEPLFGKTGKIDWRLLPLLSLENRHPFFLDPLTAEEKEGYAGHLHVKRKTEYLAIRTLKNLDFNTTPIAYLPSGKPYFEHIEVKIGISHSKNFALWAFAPIPFGCDVEEIDERLIRVAERFCSAQERLTFSENDLTLSLTILWACKEAIYKLCDDPGIHWKTDMVCMGEEKDQWVFSVRTFGIIKSVMCAVIPMENAILAFAYDV